ncbi:MAG: hypothetical protein LUG26_07545 [Ruminococcus sp.]|nr:hypothetical protein [Ruminococcus sp.]
MVIMLVIATSRDDEEEQETSCAQCVYTGLYEDCKDCPVSEEAEKIGNR